jgi:hypothetical protein
MTSLLRHYRLEPQQYHAIGRVVVAWSEIQLLLQEMLCRLSGINVVSGITLLIDLGIDQQLAALRKLVTMHRLRYKNTGVAEALLTDLEQLPRQINEFRAKRNKIVHYIWYRQGEEGMLGVKYANKHITDSEDEGSATWFLKTEEINNVADNLELLADRMTLLRSEVATRPEPWPCNSPST